MQTLGLDRRLPVVLPASRLGEELADAYVCDVCGCDLTKLVHAPHGHSRTPYGPWLKRCQCGTLYRTGYAEWNQRSDREQAEMIREIWMGIATLALLAWLFFLLFRLAGNHPIFSGVLAVVLAVPCLAFAMVSATFVTQAPDILCSVLRTTFGRKSQS
jgi:hypothetical protein